MLVKSELTNGSLGVIDPVGSKEPAKGSNEIASTIVVYLLSQRLYLTRFIEELEIVVQEFDCTSSDRNASFQGIDWLSSAAEVITHCCQQSVAGKDRLLANIVE